MEIIYSIILNKNRKNIKKTQYIILCNSYMAKTSHNDTKCTPLLKVAHPLTYFAHPLFQYQITTIV